MEGSSQQATWPLALSPAHCPLRGWPVACTSLSPSLTVAAPVPTAAYDCVLAERL